MQNVSSSMNVVQETQTMAVLCQLLVQSEQCVAVGL